MASNKLSLNICNWTLKLKITFSVFLPNSNSSHHCRAKVLHRMYPVGKFSQLFHLVLLISTCKGWAAASLSHFLIQWKTTLSLWVSHNDGICYIIIFTHHVTVSSSVCVNVRACCLPPDEPFNVSGILLNTGCPDCLVFSANTTIGTNTFSGLQLLSKNNTMKQWLTKTILPHYLSKLMFYVIVCVLYILFPALFSLTINCTMFSIDLGYLQMYSLTKAKIKVFSFSLVNSSVRLLINLVVILAKC